MPNPNPPKPANPSNLASSPTRQADNRQQVSTAASTAQTSARSMDITQDILQKIGGLGSLKEYKIRELVTDAEKFGPYLKNQRLETNQIRKFLDAVNQLKATLAQEGNFSKIEPKEPKEKASNSEADREAEEAQYKFSKIENELVLLKPKLAYAAARQEAAKPLSKVMAAAIDKVHSVKDFERFVQLIESILAYHKAEGGK